MAVETTGASLVATTPTEYPCKTHPGNTWYSFTAHGHTVGVSDRPGRIFRLDVEETDAQVTLVVVDEAGRPAVDADGRSSAVVITKQSPQT